MNITLTHRCVDLDAVALLLYQDLPPLVLVGQLHPRPVHLGSSGCHQAHLGEGGGVSRCFFETFFFIYFCFPCGK